MKSMTGGSPAGFFAAIDSQPQLRELLRLKHNEFGTLLGKYNLQMPKDINPNGFYEGQIVKNRQTGARMIYKNNNWYPIISKTPGTRPE